MAITLNLLPQDQIVSGSLSKIMRLSKSLGVIFLVMFIMFSIGVTVLIFTNNSKINNLTSENTKLLSELSTLETSEQQMFLLKDRLKKIETLKAIPSSLSNLSGIVELVGTLSPTAKVTELDVDSKKADLTVNFKSSSDMSIFLDTVKQSPVFKSVIISSFGLSPTTGYLVGFNLLSAKK